MKYKESDIVGKRYGRLLVIKESERINDKRAFECKCDCGTERVIVKFKNLQAGYTKSCGCIKKEHIKSVSSIIKVDYGEYNKFPHWKKLYHVWKTTNAKCYNNKVNNYKYYGAKDISVCDEWRKNETKYPMIKFYNWAIENGYQEGLELDRVDNSKGYSPDNCRWITHTENCRNMDSNIILKIWNEEMTAGEFIERMQSIINRDFDAEITEMVCEETIRERYLSGERNPFKLIKNKILGYRFLEIDGITKTIFDWCKEFKITYLLVRKRYHTNKIRGKDLFKSPRQPIKRKFYEGFDDINLAISDKERRIALEKHGIVE